MFRSWSSTGWGYWGGCLRSPSIQPTGAMFDPPARLTLPNVDGHRPGAQVEMFSYDHDLEEFVAIGLGSVSENGTVITTNPGVGVVKAGWHCGAQPGGSGTGYDCGECGMCDGSTCKTDPSKKDMPLESQAPGDCSLNTCGGPKSDDSDTPEDKPGTCIDENVCTGPPAPDDSEQPKNVCMKCQGGSPVVDPDKESPQEKDPHDCLKKMCDGSTQEALNETKAADQQTPEDCAVATCDP